MTRNSTTNRTENKSNENLEQSTAKSGSNVLQEIEGDFQTDQVENTQTSHFHDDTVVGQHRDMIEGTPQAMLKKQKSEETLQVCSDLISESNRDVYTTHSKADEKHIMFDHIMTHFPIWGSRLQSVNELEFKRLRGNSNACYKVSILDGLYVDLTTRAVLYRRYEQQMTDK